MLIEENVREYTNGLIYTHVLPEKANNKVMEEFRKEYLETYGENPDLFAALAYDNILMLKQAMKNCDYEDVNCVRDNLLQIKDFEGASGITTIDKDGDAHKPIYLKTIKNGEFVMYGE